MKSIDYENFYQYELPKFVKILKNDLSNKLDNDVNLTIEDYLLIFLDFFINNNAYNCFTKDLIESDDIYVGFYLSNWESYIYLRRNLSCDYSFDKDFFYEQTQIKFRLGLDIKWQDDKISESVKIIRRKNNEIEFQQPKTPEYIKDTNFNYCKEKIFEIVNISKCLRLIPNYIELSINVDV